MADQDNEQQMPTEPVNVYDVIMFMADQMAAIAWQKLGLQPDMVTGKLEKDFEQAKVAIDLTSHLASFIEPRLDDDSKRRMHNLVRDLRINYVEKAKDGGE